MDSKNHLGDTLNHQTVSHQDALELATRCADLLQERFGAKRVIPFGSVAGYGNWHPGSDLDLAVEGLAPEQFFRAWSTLHELLPPGLDVDLVDLEQASQALHRDAFLKPDCDINLIPVSRAAGKGIVIDIVQPDFDLLGPGLLGAQLRRQRHRQAEAVGRRWGHGWGVFIGNGASDLSKCAAVEAACEERPIVGGRANI